MNHNDVISINKLSKDFSTKLILKAIKIANTRQFRITPFNFVSGVVRRLKLEKGHSKQTNQKRHRIYYRRYRKPVVKQPLPD